MEYDAKFAVKTSVKNIIKVRFKNLYSMCLRPLKARLNKTEFEGYVKKGSRAVVAGVPRR